jgi:hypothetical protein
LHDEDISKKKSWLRDWLLRKNMPSSKNIH